jgi:hypothetical protein
MILPDFSAPAVCHESKHPVSRSLDIASLFPFTEQGPTLNLEDFCETNANQKMYVAYRKKQKKLQSVYNIIL